MTADTRTPTPAHRETVRDAAGRHCPPGWSWTDTGGKLELHDDEGSLQAAVWQDAGGWTVRVDRLDIERGRLLTEGLATLWASEAALGIDSVSLPLLQGDIC